MTRAPAHLLIASAALLGVATSATAAEIYVPARAARWAPPCDCAPLVAAPPLVVRQRVTYLPPVLPVFRVDQGPSYPETVLSYAEPTMPPAEIEVHPYVYPAYAVYPAPYGYGPRYRHRRPALRVYGRAAPVTSVRTRWAYGPAYRY
ncbi:MAG TPA: hypothetical protein VGD36_16945 [Xanthobacteraceae bacterium]|jgi:hypothetical protein